MKRATDDFVKTFELGGFFGGQIQVLGLFSLNKLGTVPLIWENDETCMKGKIRTVFRMITHWTTLVTSTGLCPINCLSLLCFLLFSSPVVCQMSNKEPWLFGLHGGLYYPIIFVEWNQPL